MRDQQNESEMSNDGAEDRALDAFLTEAFGGPSPPDLSDRVLARLYNQPLPTPAAVSVHKPNNERPRRNLGALLSLVAAIAAALAVAVALREPPARPGGPGLASEQDAEQGAQADDSRSAEDKQQPAAAATNRGRTPSQSTADETEATTDPTSLPEAFAVTPPNRRRPLSMETVPFGANAVAARSETETAWTKTPRAEPQPPAAIGKELELRFQQAWEHLAVQPTAAAEPAEIAGRLRERLSIDAAPGQATDASAIARLARSQEASETIARRLLVELLGPAWQRLKTEPRQTLTQFVSYAIQTGQPFDETIEQLFVGGNLPSAHDASQVWLTSLAGERSVPITQQVGHGLLDLDLGCARCHDHPIDSQIHQQDFWGLAAVFENGLQYSRGKAGEPVVEPTASSPTPKGLFYELQDGRQRVALPAMPAQWLDLQPEAGDAPESLTGLDAVAEQWRDNPRLARSLVNRVWSAVYGRPLTGAVSDPDAPPHEAHFVELRDYLAAQTRAHDFSLADLVSWVVTAPPMRRSVVLEPLSDRAAFASDEQLAKAEFLHRTFAGFDSSPSELRFEGLLSMASRWNGGGAIQSLPALAQPIDSDANIVVPQRPSDAERLEKWLRASFPESQGTDTDLPAQWLASIDDFDQQAKHLYYAAGFWKPSEKQLRAATELNESAGNSGIALKQLWWALRKSR